MVLERAIGADLFPLAVASTTCALADDFPVPPPPSDWQLAMIAGYEQPAPGVVDRRAWRELTGKRWFGTGGYVVRDRAAAEALLAEIRAEDRPLDRAWSPCLDALRSYGTTPPLLVEVGVDIALTASLPVRPVVRGHRHRERTLEGAPIWWLNLDRRPDRRRWMEWQLRDWPGPVTRVRAVDGLLLDASELPTPEQDRYGRSERHIRGDTATDRSHRAAVEAIMEMRAYPSIILEDDARLTRRWAYTMPPKGWQLALLGSIPSTGESAQMAAEGWARLDRDSRFKSTHAYVVGDEAAARALQRAYLREFDGGSDLVWRSAFGKVTTYAAVPPRCRQGIGDTDVQWPADQS
jgi:hypothetical protein